MKIYAHRGHSGFFPENTMSAFIQSLDLDIHGIELDVHKTKDGVLVVNHDETVDRMYDGKGAIKKMTFEQLSELKLRDEKFRDDPNCKILKLEDVFELIKPTRLGINIEIKTDKVSYKGIEEDVIKVVKKYNMEKRVIISSFNHKTLKKCKAINSNIETAYLVGADTFRRKNIKKILKICEECECKYLHPAYDVVDKEVVVEAHKKNILVQVYTVNSITVLRKLMKFKVDGVFTNYPKIINGIANAPK